MINIHDSEEVYEQVQQDVEKRIKEEKEGNEQKKQKIEDRLAFINRT